MATKYFDRNGTTAGFGTLTGAWDTTTASWSDSAAGTATPATYTFTDVDVAQFGADGASATAGTATIATATTVTLNQVITQNLTGLQVIAATGTGKLLFAGTDPTIDVQSAGSLRISAPIDGTKGFKLDKTAGATYELVELTNATNTVTTADGPINVATTLITVDPTTASFNFGDAREFLLTGGWRLGDFTTAQTLAANTTFAGTGCLETFNNGTNLVTFPAGALAGLTGTNEPAITYLAGSTNATSGLALYITSTIAGTRNNLVDINDLPYLLTYQSERATASTLLGRVRFIGTGASYPNARIDLLARGAVNSTTATLSQELYANQASGALIFGGGIKRKGHSQTQTFSLRGTSTEANAINGAIEELGALTIAKLDAGRWNLGGTSNYTGQTIISGGTLGATAAGALGAAAGGTVRIESTGVLELIGGITLNKSSSDFEIHTNNPIQSDGDNTVRTRGITLGGTVSFDVGAGDRLVIDNANPISNATGTRGITKAGDGELQLAATANTFNGAVTISAGTLAVTSMNNHSVAGVFGNSALSVAVTGTLKYAGTGAVSTDKVQLVGATPTLEATGTGAATFTALAATDEARQLVLKGTSSAANTVSAAVANTATQVTGVKKQGTGRWVMSGALSCTGAIDVEGGTLRVQTANSNTTSGAVTISAGAVVELVTDTLASAGGTSGKVLGTSNVTVAGDIKTRGGATQKGMVRYGGNLTFQSGSRLYIGAAA